jgi:hypothetical protein
MSSIAYMPIYVNKNSVDHKPARDYAIGVANGVVGCGTKFTEATRKRLTWFTIIDGHLVYNGPLNDYLPDFNPWAASGKTWYTYKVNHHHDLGPIDEVLASAGVTRAVLPNSQNRYIKDCPEIRLLINYAKAQVAKTSGS